MNTPPPPPQLMLPTERDDIVRMARRHVLYQVAHERAAAVWAYSTFWITALTAVIAGLAGVVADTNEKVALYLGLAGAITGSFSAAMQKNASGRDLEGRHKQAADRYRDAYDEFRAGIGEAKRANRLACSLTGPANRRLSEIQRKAPRVTPFLLARWRAARDARRLSALMMEADALDLRPVTPGRRRGARPSGQPRRA